MTEERYDRDFEVVKAVGCAMCLVPDSGWRSAMRKRARAAGIRIRTVEVDGGSLHAIDPDFVSKRNWSEGPHPLWVEHRNRALRERDEYVLSQVGVA